MILGYYDCNANHKPALAWICCAPSCEAKRVARVQSPNYANPASRWIAGFFYFLGLKL